MLFLMRVQLKSKKMLLNVKSLVKNLNIVKFKHYSLIQLKNWKSFEFLCFRLSVFFYSDY